jgi:hypothetical protein
VSVTFTGSGFAPNTTGAVAVVYDGANITAPSETTATTSATGTITDLNAGVTPTIPLNELNGDAPIPGTLTVTFDGVSVTELMADVPLQDG